MPTPPSSVRHVVLVGLMGSGKTTVGRLIADGLGWPLRDSDIDIAAREGRTARELRDALGTEALHAIEAGHLLDALADGEPAVICAAASTIDDDRCRDALRDPSLLVAWLTTTPATAASRFDREGHRPRFGDDTEGFLAAQAAERGPRFRSLDAVVLVPDGRAPEELADEIVRMVTSRR